MKNNLGIAVNSLENLDDILENITEKQYSEMKMNTIEIAKKLRKGDFIKNAVKKIENITE